MYKLPSNAERRVEVQSLLGNDKESREYIILRSIRSIPCEQWVVDGIREGRSILDLIPQDAIVEMTMDTYNKIHNHCFSALFERQITNFTDIHGRKFMITHGDEEGKLQTGNNTWEHVEIPEDVTLISCFMGVVNPDRCLFKAMSEVGDEIIATNGDILTVRFYSYDYYEYFRFAKGFA